MMEDAAALNLPNPIRCIVKLGGAAITCKNELEKVNEHNLETVSSHLRQAFITGSGSQKVLGMDWSRAPGKSEISCDVNDFEQQTSFDSSSFVVVHGAGSFGHFQASKSGVHKGGLSQPLVKAGFVATRISVTTLNLEIVRALAREGIPSIGMSPFSCGWSTSQRNITSANLSMVAKAINSGFIPVLHGDAVLDELLGCTILSGDVIIRHLATYLKPEYVVFLTDVPGVYDRPPTDPDAVLLREIAVNEDGSWSVVDPRLQNTNKTVEITVAAHDTTGGMETKISEAAMIAKLGIDVYIVEAATSHSLRALRGEVQGAIPDDWRGTVIRFADKGIGST
ncbi:isopentenyl phosphate kinase [Mercurialis annua]|uniref:isopentenyl phosphate kinase n=1 Tax=Mercurialis annua TaxID=3986 RepID=UPI00215E554D|nr:isopentenyl phosphate kinase [Mercurialis annua]